VAAFRATLEETIHADLLLHVVDGASPSRMEQIEQVNEVLREIGADHVPQILVWNKIDAAGLEPGVERDEYDKISRVFISAHSGAGLDLLRESIVEAAKSMPDYRGAPAYENQDADAQDHEAQDDALGLAADDASVDAAAGDPADNMPTSTLVGPH